jgi:hypothetical protein
MASQKTRSLTAIRSQLGGTAADVHQAHAESASHVAFVECVFSQSTLRETVL